MSVQTGKQVALRSNIISNITLYRGIEYYVLRKLNMILMGLHVHDYVCLRTTLNTIKHPIFHHLCTTYENERLRYEDSPPCIYAVFQIVLIYVSAYKTNIHLCTMIATCIICA